jgi:lipoyl(octanoyl) transferase
MTDTPPLITTPPIDYEPAVWRLLHTPPLDGPSNMAVDEAILLAVAEGAARPTLRFFAWTPPCLSLGYAQPAGEVDLQRLAELGYDLVRRPTGGRAILHTDELTYSVIAPMTEARVRGGVVESYQQLSAGLMWGLMRLGLQVRADKKYARREGGGANGPVCFETPSNYEITVGLNDQPRKLLGSAQVRKHGVVLQHGTLPLHGDIGRICDVLVFPTEDDRARVRRRVNQRATTVSQVIGSEISWQVAAAEMAAGFGAALRLQLELGELSPAEQARADTLRAEKYASDVWNKRV